jgi:hypothetical protein
MKVLFFTLLEYLFIQEFTFKRCFMNPFSLSVKELEQKARAIRRRIIVLNAESPAGGHTGADLSQVELLTALYFASLTARPRSQRATSAIFISVERTCCRRLLLRTGRSRIYPR